MIALGSCTMKLNAVAEMIPSNVARELAAPHPFVHLWIKWLRVIQKMY